MRARTAAGLAATAALLAACGSTVQTSQSAVGLAPSGVVSTPGTTSGDSGLTVPGTTTGGAVAGAGSTTATGTGTAGTGSGGAGSTGTGTASGPSSSQGGSSSGSGSSPVIGPGITASTISVGIEYSSDEGAADKAIGAAGAAPSYDTRDVVNAFVKYANDHGGFAGRRLSPIYYNVSVSSNQDVADQAACSSFTQDHKVFVMDGTTDILRACAEKAGAISLIGDSTAVTFQKYPHFIEPNGIRLDRLGPATVNGLYRAGYFTGKLGLVTWDDPNFRYAMTHGYLPALSSHHITPTQTAYVAVPQQVGAVADMSAAMRSVVAKFRSLGIDHVIIVDGHAGVWAGTGLTLEFMDQAKSQGYYPRYGQNSNNSPGWSGLPSDEMDKSLAIMNSDYSERFDAGWHPNPTRQKCFKIQADAGMPVSSSNDNDQVYATEYCDFVFFVQQVMNQLGASLNSDAFINAVEHLGTGFKSAFTYGTRFFAGRLDGADEVRTAEYLQSCQCLKYAGPPYQPD
jgi:hypothetical protein